MTSLTIERVSKRFDGTAGLALDDVSLEVDAGELLVLLGPSGSGKTTLLRCIAGLLQPTSGRISLDGTVVADPSLGLAVAPYRRNLGMVFQNFALWPHMTVRDNVQYPLRARRWESRRSERRAAEMLALVRCTELAGRLPATLSGGQQQRIALARALAAEPALILFDEPLSNLDALLRVELRAQLRLIHRETGFTGVYVTHDQTEALSLGTRIAVMNHGRVEQLGTPEQIYAHPATEFTAEFMGMLNRIELSAGDSGWSAAEARVRAGAALPPARPGDTLAIRFRPDDLVLHRAGAVGATSADRLAIDELRIVDRAFHGECIEYVAAAGEALLKSRVARSAVQFDVGDAVTGTIADDRLAWFAVQPAGARRVAERAPTPA